MNAQQQQRIEAIFQQATFIQTVGVKLDTLEAGKLQTSLVLRTDHQQQNGFVHAGVMATMADHSAGCAAASLMPPDKAPLTIEFKINFLKPAVGELLRCHATVLRAGRTVSVAESEVYTLAHPSAQPTLVAKAMVTLAVVDTTKS